MNNEKLDLIKSIIDSDVEGDSMEKIKAILDEKQERKLPSSWEELPELRGGGYICDNSILAKSINNEPTHCTSENQNVSPTVKDSRAILSLIRLTQLLDYYNENWRADDSDVSQYKYCIKPYKSNKWEPIELVTSSRILAFKTPGLRDHFLAQPDIVKDMEKARRYL